VTSLTPLSYVGGVQSANKKLI